MHRTLMRVSMLLWAVVSWPRSRCFYETLEMTLEDLAALKGITGLQLLPTIDGTRLHTDHILVAVLGLKIADAIRLLNPRVPDDGILQIVTNHIEPRLAV